MARSNDARQYHNVIGWLCPEGTCSGCDARRNNRTRTRRWLLGYAFGQVGLMALYYAFINHGALAGPWTWFSLYVLIVAMWGFAALHYALHQWGDAFRGRD